MIGKTRHQSDAIPAVKPFAAPAVKPLEAKDEVFDPAAGPARGVLQSPPSAGQFRHVRRSPAPELAHCIAHYWFVSWDLRGLDPHIAETLPHPNVHAIFEPAGSTVAGVHTAKFSRRLEGRSHAFGVKFTPGGFRAFLNAPVSSLADRTVPVREIFGNEIDLLDAILSISEDEEASIATANRFFSARIPAVDDSAVLAAVLVDRILSEPDIRTVDDLSARARLGKRSLQRLFNEYVGVSPKWVIRRYRLHELLERVHSGAEPDYAQLALELGYYDQAHLINDFRSIVGYSPTQYQGR
jgi:AraC-like DNA-binding protein